MATLSTDPEKSKEESKSNTPDKKGSDLPHNEKTESEKKSSKSESISRGVIKKTS